MGVISFVMAFNNEVNLFKYFYIQTKGGELTHN